MRYILAASAAVFFLLQWLAAPGAPPAQSRRSGVVCSAAAANSRSYLAVVDRAVAARLGLTFPPAVLAMQSAASKPAATI